MLLPLNMFFSVLKLDETTSFPCQFSVTFPGFNAHNADNVDAGS